jgi:hypothetical protein
MEMEWAKEFLLERLEDGPVKSNDILDEARQKGIAEKILKQAKKDLGVKSRKEQGTADGAWFWELPTKAIKRSPPPKNGPGGADAPPVAPVAVSPNGTERGLSDLRIRQLAPRPVTATTLRPPSPSVRLMLSCGRSCAGR